MKEEIETSRLIELKAMEREVHRLESFLERTFPQYIGKSGFEHESAVSLAIRLLSY